MANAAIVIDNLADGKTVVASSQVLTMPASNLLTPHPQERWRSIGNGGSIILDKGALLSGDTVALLGLTCSTSTLMHLRLSTVDSLGLAGDVFDDGGIHNGDGHLDTTYNSLIYRLSAPVSYRYVRIDLFDPTAALLAATNFVEAGCILDGLSETFAYNFSWSAGFQHHDRSGVVKVAGGGTLTWQDNTYRSISLPFDWITSAQRYGVIERLDRVKGKTSNILLMTDTASTNMPRDSIFGLVTEQTQIGFVQGVGLFTKALNFEERI